MEELIGQIYQYLSNQEDEGWQMFDYSAWTELLIPKSAKAIKDKVKDLEKDLKILNLKVNYQALPAIRQNKELCEFLGQDLIGEHETYFQDEKEALTAIRTMLKAKSNNFGTHFAKNSYCGLMVHAVAYLHTNNIDKLKKATNYWGSLQKGVHMYVDESTFYPSEDDKTLIKSISTTINTCLKNKELSKK